MLSMSAGAVGAAWMIGVEGAESLRPQRCSAHGSAGNTNINGTVQIRTSIILPCRRQDSRHTEEGHVRGPLVALVVATKLRSPWPHGSRIIHPRALGGRLVPTLSSSGDQTLSREHTRYDLVRLGVSSGRRRHFRKYRRPQPDGGTRQRMQDIGQ